MDIHKYEKWWLVASLALIVLFISTVVYASAVVGVEMVDESGGTVDVDNVTDHERFSDPGVVKVGENEYEVNMVARRFVFRPGSEPFGPVRVPANSTVTFYITSADVIHGFQIVGTNVNTMVVPGQISKITVEFDEPKEYGILCNEYCGSGHHDMGGNLVVVPEDEWGDEQEQGGDG